MRFPRLTRTRRAVAVMATVGVTAAMGAAAVGVSTRAEAAAVPLFGDQQAECPEGTIPGPGNIHPNPWTDNNIAVYAGQDFRTGVSAAEVEGLLVVEGDATIGRSTGTFNIGSVGVGSGVWPSAGSTMFAVGGGLTISDPSTAHIDVGFGVTDGGTPPVTGGDVQVGGTTNPLYVGPGDVSPYLMNGGTLTQNMGAAATSPWAGWGDTISQESAAYAAMPATGTVQFDGTSLTLTSTDPTADPQVFNVPGADLVAANDLFDSIDDSVQAVIINVTGSAPVSWTPQSFWSNGSRADDFASPLFGKVAQRTMWNFPDAPSVTVAGSSQVLGSILVPAADTGSTPALTITASTNGRVMTNGTIFMDGKGNELHNYPWNYGPFSCIAVPGAFEITKSIQGEGDASGIVFTGTYSCTDESGAVVATGVWGAEAGGTSGRLSAPVGSTCTITEDQLLRGGGTWETVSISPNPVTITAGSVLEPVQVSVVNQLTPLPMGAFTITKTVNGEGAPTETFSGDWTCRLGDASDSGTWSAAAGETAGPFVEPVGATCTVTENTPAGAAGGSWGTPVITGSPVTITDASAETPVEVTVTNTWTPTPPAGNGAFTVTKSVTGDGAPSLTFAGAWACTLDGATVASGTWSAAAGKTDGPFEAPVGASCVVTENTPPVADGGSWGNPVITGSPVTITEASAETPVQVSVKNTWTPSTPTPSPTPTEPAPPLPATGGTPAFWLIPIGVVLLAGGGVAIWLTSRRRKQ